MLQGLTVAGESVLSDQKLKKVSSTAIQCILNPPDKFTSEESLSEVGGPAKEAFAALTAFYLEAARVDADVTALSTVLEECKISTDRAEAIAATYTERRHEVRAALERVGSSPPHLVDVHWRLDYYLKSNHVERLNRPEFLLELTTHATDGSTQPILLACTQDQLQDLVAKLKDASKSLEKFAQH